MRLKATLVVVVALFIVVGGAHAQYGGSGTPPAAAQDAKPAQEKGVKTRGLVTSLGGFRGAASVPIVLTGQIVEIEPGGQTGRQRFLVPSYIYVLEGTLTTNSERAVPCRRAIVHGRARRLAQPHERRHDAGEVSAVADRDAGRTDDRKGAHRLSGVIHERLIRKSKGRARSADAWTVHE
jgi:hypothetical protein